MPDQSTSLSGVLLSGRYLIEKSLGRGGIGAVYLARDNQLLSKPVVIKVLLEETDQNPWFKKKFAQEVEALARIDHPGVVGVLGTGEMPDGKPYMVMQFIEGTNLRSVMRMGRMDVGRVAKLLRQMCHALGAAHDKGIYHRDLKPENIMVQILGEGEEHIKLIDFGIATVKDSQVGTSNSSTMVAGSVAYMAPEQLAGKPSAASDIYALGVIAYEMVTGRMPFYADTIIQLYEMQKVGVQTRPRQLQPHLPQSVDNAILMALRFAPSDRFRRARDFADSFTADLPTTPNNESDRSTLIARSPAEPNRAVKVAIPMAAVPVANTRVIRASSPATRHVQSPGYLSFAKPILLLILIVGVARLALSLGGVQSSEVKWFSISVILLIGLIYFSIRVHTSGFGSYKQLLLLLLLQSVIAQGIIITGIMIAMATGRDNIFSVPEYAGGGDGKTWLHVGAHLVLGTTVGPLLSWLVGSIIMWVTKKVSPTETVAA